MKDPIDLQKEIEKLRKEMIYTGMRQFTSSNIEKRKKLKELIKKQNDCIK